MKNFKHRHLGKPCVYFLKIFIFAVRQKARSSVYCKKTCSDGDARTNSGKLFQTIAGKVRSPIVERTVVESKSAVTDMR